MNKFFLSVLFSLSLNVFSQDEDPNCATSPLSAELEKLATSLQIPNCNNRKIVSAANKGDFTKLCDTCALEFEEATKKMPTVTASVNPYDLNKVLADELKRSLSAQLLNIVNLRSGFPQADFGEAVGACDLKAFSKRIDSKKCATPDFNSLSIKMSEELGHILGETPSFDDEGILNRKLSKGSCQISDSAILRAKASVLETAIDEDMVNDILGINAQDETNFEIELAKLAEKRNIPLSSALRSHPIFVQIVTPPKDLQSFLSTLKRPIKSENLKAAMYSNKKANQTLVKNIAKKCNDAFSTYEKLACNADIKAGKIKIDTLKDTGVFMLAPETNSKPFIDLSSESEIKSNLELINICKMRTNKKDALNFSESISVMNSQMLEEDAAKPFETYRTDKYENEIGSIRKAICKIQNGEYKCEKLDYPCLLAQALKTENTEGTLEFRLAKSSDKGINNLLRSIIGQPDANQLSAATRATLIKEGIIPKNEKGEFVAQPEIPERQPEFINKLAANAVKAPTSSAASSNQVAPKSVPAKAPLADSSSSSASYAIPETLPTATSASAAPVAQGLDGIDSEILRRLSQGSKPGDAKKPITKDEARKAVRDEYQKQGKTITPAQEIAAADRVMSSYNSQPPQASAADIPEDQKAHITPGDNAKEQWAKEQKLRALSGMAGAQASAAGAAPDRGPASESAVVLDDKKLSTVSLNVAEDKVKLNLSEVLDEKILKDDSEGQLLKVFIQNKKDFILQVNNVSFKVRYDKSTGLYKLAFSQGDFAEADRLRPQLEKFFGRMNTKSAK